MLSKIKPISEHYLSYFVKPLASVDPNRITFLGILPPLLFFVLVVLGHHVAALLITPLFCIDMLDGVIARVHKKESAFGGFLDSSLDRISDFLIISAFGFAQLVSWEIVVTLIFVSLFISYIRSRAELATKGTKKIDVGLIERPERLIFIIVSLFLYVLFSGWGFNSFNILKISFVILIILSCITCVQRMWVAWKVLK